MKTLRILIIGLLTTVTLCQSQITDPGWFRMTTLSRPPLSTPTMNTNQVQALGQSSPLNQPNVPATPIAEAITPQIQALADSLCDKPDLIFNWVHDHIKFVLYFGSKKGANLTLLEKSGNDFDQSALLVALLSAAGYSNNVAYQFGWMQMPYDDPNNKGYDLHHWWQLTLPNTNWTTTSTYLEDLLMQRGYPAYYDPGDGNYFFIQRTWVVLTNGSTTYQLDPAFKINMPVPALSGFSLTNAMGSGTISNDLLTAASGTDNVNYAQGLSEASVRSKLTGYATNLLNFIQSNSPNASVQQILGGWQIVPAYDPSDFTSTTHFTTETFGGQLPILTWTYEPTNMMSTLKITFAGTNYQWYFPQLQGQRLALTFDTGGNAQLWQDDSNLLSQATSGSSLSTNVIIYVHHPDGIWSANNTYIDGNYADQTATNAYQRTNSTYAIMYAFEPDWGWLQQRENKLDTYLQQGLTNGTRQVTSESLNIMGLNWLLQTKAVGDMLAQQLGMSPMYYHRIGRMAQETGHGYYVDVYMQFCGEYPSGGDDVPHIQISNVQFDLMSFFASSMEHGLIEQLQNTNLVAASTVKMLQIANTNGQAVYLASSNNWTTGFNVQSYLTGYDSGTLGIIFSNYINQGYYVLLPANGSNHVSAVSGSWAGYGYEARQAVNGRATISQMAISGGYHGGYSAFKEEAVDCNYVNVASDSQPGTFTTSPIGFTPITIADPVDAADGTFQVEHTDLSLGQAEPRGITLSRYYNGTRRNSNPAGMAGGWIHNYCVTANNIPAPEAGLGGTTPAQSAAMLTATAAAIATYNGGTPNGKNWLTTALITKWGVDQLTKNGVSVSLGKDTVQFVQQPNGVFTPPPNCTLSLTQNGSAYTLSQRHGNAFNFNSQGRLTNIVDQYGQSLSLTYTNSNLVSTVKDWKGRQFTFYYTSNQLTSVSDGTRTIKYSYSAAYNPQGDLVSFTDAEGNPTTYGYDTNHQITATLDALNRLVVSNVYDSQGHITTQYTQGDTNKTWRLYWSSWQTVEQDPAGGQRVFTYDDQGRLVSVKDQLGNLSQTFYDGQNHVVMTVSPLNETNRYIYDNYNNLVASIDPLNYTNQFFYDNQNNLVRSVDPRGNPSTFGYNTNFSLTGSTNGAGDWVNYAFNADGTLHTRTDAAGNTTTYGYDGNGIVSSITYPNSLGSESFVNNSIGDPTSHTDGNGNVTSFYYNLRRDLTNTVAPTNVTLKIAFDAVGNATSATDPRGNSVANTWSATRHLLKTTLPTTSQGTPAVTNYYDSRDWLVKTVDPLLQPTLYTNDSAGRLISATDPLQRTVKFGYDADGHKIATTNAQQEVTRQSWDARGNLIQLTDGAGHFSTRAYDAAGNQIILTNRNGKKWQFQFDGANRLTNTITPLGRSSSLVFNHQGLVSATKDPANQNTSLSYDGKGRLSTRTDSLGTTYYGYDANNNQTSVRENGLTNTWTYDAYNRVASYRDILGNLIQYRYDASGNVTNLIYPGGKSVYYSYDSNNHLTSVTDWAQRKTSISYDLAGHVTTIIRPNGSYRTIGYDVAGQATNIMEQMSNSLPIAIFKHGWTNSGSMAWEFAAPLPHTPTVPTRTMTYDDDNRLATFKVGTSSALTIGSDADGNLISAPLMTNTLATYAYDARNRLLNVGGVTNAYDTLNNHVGLISGTNSTVLVVNPNAKLPQVLMRIKNGVTNYYIYGAGLLYQITETATATNTLTYHYDFRGSTIALSADNGLVTDRIEYSAYGLTTYRAGTNDTPFLFNGRYGVQTDPNGLLYMRARYYNPYLCRFVSADPSGFAGGLNHYAYANGNPVSYLDPFGLNAAATGDESNSWLDRAIDSVAGVVGQQADKYGALVNNLDTQTAWKQPLNYASSALMLGLSDATGILNLLGATPDSLNNFAATFPVVSFETKGVAAFEEVVAAEGGAQLPATLYHYTGEGNVANILEKGLGYDRPLTWTTPVGTLSPVQAQIELALPANRGYPGALFEIDTARLQQLGINPAVGPQRIMSTPNAGGGGIEYIFNQPIPPSAIRQVPFP